MKPNILLIHCHDLGRHLSCYDSLFRTPNIDRIAEEGFQFNQAYCSAPHCSPSRGSIMTGKSPHAHGLMGLAHMGWSLKEEQTLLTHTMQGAGYETHLFGLQHEDAEGGATLGYDTIHDTTGTKAANVTDKLCEWLKAHPTAIKSEDEPAPDAKPFFASIGFSEPHRPFPIERGDYDIDRPEAVVVPEYLPDEMGIRRDMAGLHGLIRNVDENMGRIWFTLRQTEILKNTLILFTTDHGIAMPRAKGTLYDPGVEVAMLMYWPGHIESGDMSDALMSNVDIMPTLLDIVGGDIPEGIEGVSQLPVIKGEADSVRDEVFVEMTYHGRYQPMRGIRTNTHKYIENFTTYPRGHVPNDVLDGQCYASSMTQDLLMNKKPAEELYHLGFDPWEKRNLAEDTSQAGIKADLKAKLDGWRESTGDPLLNAKPRAPKLQSEHNKKTEAREKEYVKEFKS